MNALISALNKGFLLLFILLFITYSCQKNNLEKTRGNVNLRFKFNMKTYPIVSKDTLCGCYATTQPSINAYNTPLITIKDLSGKIIYYEYCREMNLVNFPLQEGDYSIHYTAKLINVIACDSARDMWKNVPYNGAIEYCINKNNFKYNNLDTAEYFSVKKGTITNIVRNF